MKKKILSLALCFLLMLSSAAALADTSIKERYAKVQSTILEKAAAMTGIDFIDFGDTCELYEDSSFTVNSWYFLESEKAGYIDLRVNVTLQSPYSIGASDYDFCVMTKDENGKFVFHWVREVYTPVQDGILQEVVFPLVFTEAGTEFCLTYRIPADTELAAFVYANMWENEDHTGVDSNGNIAALNIRRTVMDFNLINRSGSAVTEFYFAPAFEKTWGDNLLERFADPLLLSGNRAVFSFCGTEYETLKGRTWECKLVFANGDACVFEGLCPDDFSAMELTLNEQGQPDLTFCR